jgi:hypothetical protein
MDGGNQAYLPPDPGPYPERARKTNTVRFTDVQVGAILAGTNQGLTQVRELDLARKTLCCDAVG